jgi:hypothetical protein
MNQLMGRFLMATTDVPLPGNTLDADVLRHLAEACRDFRAVNVERVALFEAATVSAKLPRAVAERDGRLGALGLTPYWGPAPARLDAYTAATSFLKEARRRREASRVPVRASRLAQRVHGGTSAASYARQWRSARRAVAESAPETSPAAPAEDPAEKLLEPAGEA